MALDPCSITTLRENSACLDCLSVSDLEVVEAYLWAVLSGVREPTIAGVLASISCLTCLSKKQIIEAKIAVLFSVAKIQTPTLTLQYILNLMRCGKCATHRQVQAAILYYFCQYFNRDNQ